MGDITDAGSQQTDSKKKDDEVVTELRAAIIRLLRASSNLDLGDKSLVWSARLLLLSGLLVIVSTIMLRHPLLPVRGFDFHEFLALLVVGCVLVAIGALLSIYQLAIDQARLRELSRLANETARDLSGPNGDPVESSSPPTTLRL